MSRATAGLSWGPSAIHRAVAGSLPGLRHRDALPVEVGDVAGLAAARPAAVTDNALRRRLVTAGDVVADRFTWRASALCHLEVYAGLTAAAPRSA